MRVEFLFFEGCPHVTSTLSLLENILLMLAPGIEVSQINVESEEQAEALGFHGSPSIRIDGIDLEGREGASTGLTCRFYGKGGEPPKWLMEAVVLRAKNPKHYLFLCTQNSARSQMAEGLARSLAPNGVLISSAGSSPAFVRPEAVQVMSEIGIDISRQRSKGLDSIDSTSVEAVFTLCDDQICPFFPGPTMPLHWAMPDPAAISGGREARLRTFREVRDALHQRLAVLFPKIDQWAKESVSD